MTREEIFEIAQDGGLVHSSHAHRIADRILSALEKEREGEVVLMCGQKYSFRRSDTSDDCEMDEPLVAFLGDVQKIEGKRGSLIFRPDTKEDK